MTTLHRTALCALPLAALLALSACSSQPVASRPTLPDRPEVHRPDGMEPEGLADIRDMLAAQRGETRALENATLVQPATLSPHSTTPWYETVFSPFADLLYFLRNQ
jgi:hypothetical protein